MTDEKLVQDDAAEKPHDEKNHSERASTGKIARLPNAIRNQLNHRLLDGQPGSKILAWLNELPVVQEILAAQFDGVPVSDQNLSQWRGGGYLRWEAERKKLDAMKELGQFAADISEAAGGSISRGVAAIVSGRILACLDKISDDAAPENLAKFASAAAKLLSGEQNSVRLKFAHERLRQRERQILLMRDKHQRDSVAIAIRVLNDDRAKAIARTKCNHTEKIELMGRHLFGKHWQSRPVPAA